MPDVKPLTDGQIGAVHENYKAIVRICEVGIPTCRDCTIRALLATIDALKLELHGCQQNAGLNREAYEQAYREIAERDRLLRIARGEQDKPDAH